MSTRSNIFMHIFIYTFMHAKPLYVAENQCPEILNLWSPVYFAVLLVICNALLTNTLLTCVMSLHILLLLGNMNVWVSLPLQFQFQ